VIDRRAFIIGAVASLAWPVTARAEPAPGMHRIGYLTPFSLTGSVMDAFRAGLLDHGYVEGKNIRIEARSSDQDASRLAALAADLVSAKVDLIVAQTGQAALAAKQATSRIPIVMASSADAVAQGIIVSLAHPGSNVTGFTLISPDYVPKRVELLRETLPKATRVAVLVCSDSLTKRDELAAAEASARRFGLRVQAVEYQTPASWDAIALSMERSRPDAMFMLDCVSVPFQAIADFTLRHRIATFSPFPAVVTLGMLLGYGPDPFVTTWRVAEYVDRVLKGAKPNDLPVQRPSTFRLAVNLKTAKALGITIPPSLLLRADQVIDR
jgi:putative tryptophan/tyrosine transport system substrate-binding protein